MVILRILSFICLCNLKLCEGVARTDVSYLRDYYSGGEEGYAGLCAFRVLFSSNPPLLYYWCIAFVFLFVLRVLNIPAPTKCKLNPCRV